MPGSVGPGPCPLTMPLPVFSLISVCAGMNWDLEAMPGQETCEPAKYGGAFCQMFHHSKLPLVLPHSCRCLAAACAHLAEGPGWHAPVCTSTVLWWCG